MDSLAEKRIVLGVCGGIAAYKAAALTSKLTQAGAQVHVILTENAMKFVQPVTFQALSHQPVYTDTFSEPDPHVISHIDLADKADLVLIAPATANVIGKIANGIADDMLTTTLLATKAPVMIAPAMNVNMYEHPAVAANMEKLASFGYRFVEPGVGLLACGWVGKGRLAEPEEIVEAVQSWFRQQAARDTQAAAKQDLLDKHVLVTAGPTREKIDPVRYITNHASGKMGYAIAEAARDRGARVTLISGPTALPRPEGVAFVAVESVQEMFDAVMEHLPQSDIVVKSAAVSDYRPKTVQAHKMKKGDGPFVLELDKAPDILKTIGERKTKQFVVGFAAETQDVLLHAQSKLERKNLDMIVANNVLLEGAGMGSDTNIVTLLTRDGEQLALEKLSKRAVADKLFDAVLLKLQQKPLSELS
ncbi:MULTISPECIES: bifunctional phosphopantothenoylcysteine decarboxylase/phosphopantothenate--cysteine ligase CoaBC [Brevibacillus]|uniref:bifunctional phosphopantothenoylcysteine decarboxylase/phosphopantothenate--cysteine ligase CoaBC n=1 Tax=Brevibacillus TaxID=55080 RepID=UPI0002A4DAAB|nr:MULTISPECIES: bifunctional phosphopantothenoylcysteine decarboxylase/phosphopantothenate--cysteine ligase CoaBC [Brevibacillus]ELK41806.1 coenzyme A biosynthesis bifunctional protein CoaBC [Brevibacillus agri BAB-2500]MDN4093110.1 bifunctional phosphopantothenoylcysteine decarboxylase/phosphopantothenate--cysteine ligase CoaBC [Brevibacillus agri]MDR9502807.1 bifunctional phosphopantothenoylcysteine decarboxylase/phosphopantothenate--cysteine ligase CoaBC [Brevibacillus agri]QHZ56102.1 bifun